MAITGNPVEYLAQLRAELADLNPTDGWGRSFLIAGLTVEINLVPLTTDQIKSVVVWGGWAPGRRNRREFHRFTKVEDLKHIAGRVRGLVEEQAKIEASRKEYADLSAARRSREEAAGATLKALVDANPQTAQEFDVTETTIDGERVIRFALKLRGLTEAQALAVLEIVKN